MKRKAFVLVSGGVDSSTALAIASMDDTFDEVEGVSVNYGQRHVKEIDCAKVQCDNFGAYHSTIEAEGIFGSVVMLTDPTQAIPDITYAEITGVSPTYVPFRNGTLLSLITAKAQAWVNANGKEPSGGVVFPSPEATIYFGAHAEDAHNFAYPDCTPEFIGAMAAAIYIGTYHAVRLVAPLTYMRKHEIVTLGSQLGVPFKKTWSCYAGGDLHCGKCPTCYARQDAFNTAGVDDPTEYAVPRKAA